MACLKPNFIYSLIEGRRDSDYFCQREQPTPNTEWNLFFSDVVLRSASIFVCDRTADILFGCDTSENSNLAMPLHALGWSTEEDAKLVELVKPHKFLYSVLDPSRKNILAREITWQEIAEGLSKPVEECKKRWRGLRDGYMRSKRLGALHKSKVGMFEKLTFLDGSLFDSDTMEVIEENHLEDESMIGAEQQVITDNQEYYEITVVDDPQETQTMKPLIKILPKPSTTDVLPPKKNRRNAGRKRAVPVPKDIPPIKILPKPMLLNGPKLVRYVEDQKTTEQRSQVIDKLIEKVLKENTNEIDVFFRSMAASVKKLQPNLIPKVKMEVCNVIAKYEMQSFDRNLKNI